MKGRFKALGSMEYHRKYTNKSPENDNKPCKNLPTNCYSEQVLSGLTATKKLTLKIRDPLVDFEDITKSLETDLWFD